MKGHNDVKPARASALEGEAEWDGTVQHEANKAQGDLLNLEKYLTEREWRRAHVSGTQWQEKKHGCKFENLNTHWNTNSIIL